ncbi:MAG: cysteine--tRNA ligase [Candidatus Saccharimonadales bacterium]
MKRVELYNTMSRQKEGLKPLSDKVVKIYTCGLTVYSQPHIGNWVAYIYWDVLVRTLRTAGYQVKRVQNITDVGHLTSDADEGDDKMVKAAVAAKKTAWDIADEIIKIADDEAYNKLGLIPPDSLVRATDYIDEQIVFVKILDEKGFTYIIEGNGVYFDTSKLKDYGKLAKLDINGLREGARVETAGKKNPTDFAVWKFSPSNEKRDMEWDSPWGKGFPGWHLECSVMAQQLLGDQIDIHTGGIDHIPVHHTNEIAQTESVTGKTFASIWIHNNHLKVDGTKISKSLGNGYTLTDIEERGLDVEAFKLMVLSSHFQTEGNFTWEILEASQSRLNNLRRMADLKFQAVKSAPQTDFAKYQELLLEVMCDNLDTPKALSILSTQVSELESNLVNTDQIDEFSKYLTYIDDLFGFSLSTRQDINTKQKQLIEARAQARLNKDWEKSDDIREKLKTQGIFINDTQNLQIWSRT